MPHFSRLTDIVTCSLTAILSEAEDPQTTLQEIIHEMEEGLAGAQRSVTTAMNNLERLKDELRQTEQEAEQFNKQAMESLQNNDENGARMALYRKKEATDLVAGLKQQVTVAKSTYESLMTTYRALEARLAEAKRKQAEMGIVSQSDSETESLTTTAQQQRNSEVEAELDALKEQLKSSSR